MDRLLEKLWKITAGDESLAMEARLYRLMTLFAGIISLLVLLPSNLLQNVSGYIPVSLGIFGLLCTALFHAACRGRFFTLTLNFLLMGLLNVTWFLSGGSDGSVAYYFLFGMIYTMVVFRESRRWLLSALYPLNGCALLLVEYVRPSSPLPFATQADRFVDLGTGFVFSGLTCAVVLWGILVTYDRERDKQRSLNERLEKSLAEIRTLRGLLPICSWCKKVRDDEGSWTQIESYIHERTDAEFSHSICPECLRNHYGDEPAPPAPTCRDVPLQLPPDCEGNEEIPSPPGAAVARK